MRPDLTPHTEPVQVLDHGFVRLVDCMGGDEDIEAAARLSFNQGTRSVDERRKLIRYLMRQKHSSPFEQVVIKLEMKLPIFVARQLVRHRTQALNEVSARYSVLPDEVYIPAPERVQAQSTANKQGSGEAIDEEIVAEFLDGLKIDSRMAFGSYDFAVKGGIARETARIGLPVNTYTRWVTTMSAHNLLHLLQLRLDEHAQWEARQYAEAIAKIVADWIPLTWEAFVEYRLRAVTLSGTEIDALREALKMQRDASDALEELLEARLPKREFNEIHAKLGLLPRLGVPPHHARERVRLGHAKVYPKPSDRIGELEREVKDLRVVLRMEEPHTETCASTVPCPFCGCDKLRIHRTTRFPGVEFVPDCGSYAWAVVCNACAAEGPWRKSDTPDSAIKAWEGRASPIMDAVRARPGLEHANIKGTDAELLRELLTSRRGWEPGQPRWSHVRLMAGHGSGVGHALCVVLGIDPNEPGPQDDGENCPRCGSLLEREDDDAPDNDESEGEDDPNDDDDHADLA